MASTAHLQSVCSWSPMRRNRFAWTLALLFVAVLLLAPLSCATPSTGSLADDQAALEDLYRATGGNSTWLKRTRWLQAAPNSTDVCTWFGVTCGPAACQANATASPCRVVSLVLCKNRLTGTPPPSFGALNALQTLDVSANSLSGDNILASISNMTVLVVLKLFANSFTEELDKASGMARLTSLTEMQLTFNLFRGRIPEWLRNISTTLVILNLDYNLLTGSIPVWLSEFRAMSTLDLSRNALSGTLPPSLSFMPSLKLLRLSTNPMMSGGIPVSFGNFPSITLLSLAAMNLSGPIPESLQNLGRNLTIKFLDLSLNRLSGIIPDGFWRVTSLDAIQISSNMLGGTISESIANISGLAQFICDRNRFVGSIPFSIGSLTKLSLFNVSHNMLSGQLPSSLGNLGARLFFFDVSFNQIESRIPSSIGGLRGLRWFYARSNKLVGPIPDSIVNMTSLTEFDARSNQISALPRSFCLPSSPLSSIDVSDNLVRNIDLLALLSCPALASLDLSRNRIATRFDVANAVRLPPFTNLSHNAMGPILPGYTVPLRELPVVAVIDIRENEFQCPYPSNHPIQIAFLFSPCAQPWMALAIDAAIFAGGILLSASIALVATRYVPAVAAFVVHSQPFIFGVSWASDCVGLVLDSLTFQLILNYLYSRIDHCAGTNLFSFFGPLTRMSTYQYACAAPPYDDFAPTSSFADFLAACELNGPNNIPVSISQFQSLCRSSLPQCDYDAATASCRTFHPELASDPRGDVYVVFTALVIFVAAVRAAVELARAVCVLLAMRATSRLAAPVDVAFVVDCCHHSGYASDSGTRDAAASGTDAGVAHQSTPADGGHRRRRGPMPLFWMAEMVGNSPLSPLLLLSAPRAEFTALLLRREPTPADLALRTLLAGFLTAVPLLCVNMWYLLRVTQYGLAPAGWLSLMKGLVLVLRMLFQAYRTALPAADKHQRSATSVLSPTSALASDAVPATIEMTLAFGGNDQSDAVTRGGAHIADSGPRQSARETDETLILAPDFQSSSLP